MRKSQNKLESTSTSPRTDWNLSEFLMHLTLIAWLTWRSRALHQRAKHTHLAIEVGGVGGGFREVEPLQTQLLPQAEGETAKRQHVWAIKLLLLHSPSKCCTRVSSLAHSNQKFLSLTFKVPLDLLDYLVAEPGLLKGLPLILGLRRLARFLDHSVNGSERLLNMPQTRPLDISLRFEVPDFFMWFVSHPLACKHLIDMSLLSAHPVQESEKLEKSSEKMKNCKQPLPHTCEDSQREWAQIQLLLGFYPPHFLQSSFLSPTLTRSTQKQEFWEMELTLAKPTHHKTTII